MKQESKEKLAKLWAALGLLNGLKPLPEDSPLGQLLVANTGQSVDDELIEDLKQGL